MHKQPVFSSHLQHCSHILSPPDEGAQVVQVQRPHADNHLDLLLAEFCCMCLWRSTKVRVRERVRSGV